MESSSSSSSSFIEDSLSRFFGLGDTADGVVEPDDGVIFRGCLGAVLLDVVDEGSGSDPFDIACSGAGDAGPAPFGRPSFARAARALFMSMKSIALFYLLRGTHIKKVSRDTTFSLFSESREYDK